MTAQTVQRPGVPQSGELREDARTQADCAPPYRARRDLAAKTDMSYVCARIHARFPRLLSPRELEQYRRLPTLAELLPRMLVGEYAAESKREVLDSADLDAWEAAIFGGYSRRLSGVCRLMAEAFPNYLDLFTGQSDLHHIRCLLRRMFREGQLGERKARPGSLSETDRERPMPLHAELSPKSFANQTCVPLGTFSREEYERLAAVRSFAEFCNGIEPLFPGLGRILLDASKQAAHEESLIDELELLAENLHFQHLLRCARNTASREDGIVIRQCTALRIDLVNLRTSLRFLGRNLSADGVSRLYVKGGSLSEKQFGALMEADVLEQLYRILRRGPLTDALERGTLAFANVNRASVFQRLFDEQQLLREKRLARRYPVSIAVPLYYASCLRNELLNLDMIVRGIHFGLPPGKVGGSLIYV
jgi:vacuolar-type H+-ATPase subunit C/Vma6